MSYFDISVVKVHLRGFVCCGLTVIRRGLMGWTVEKGVTVPTLKAVIQ